MAVDDVLRFEREYLEFLRRNTALLTTIRDSGKLDDETKAGLEKALADFRQEFRTSEGKPLGTEPEPKKIGDEDVEHEQIVVKKA
ncbi:hypothetical protein SDC9_97279 [bioreactor metagenome]|uniref:ATP synthase subunit alpha n=1 Tax=bioreactor metagenome TaxID=1076179 RepID=A0A645ABY3_9ZZZZ